MVLGKSRLAQGAMLTPSELFSVHGRTALVTGGATGLGRVCAEALLRAGARVLIASRKAEACEAAAHELSAFGPCEGFGGTVANEAGVAALVAETRRRTEVLHILVNNAGLTWGEPFETLSLEGLGTGDERQCQRACSRSPAISRRRCSPRRRAEQPSNVVNLGSVMGTVDACRRPPTPIPPPRRRCIT